jgi:hypothetical protein
MPMLRSPRKNTDATAYDTVRIRAFTPVFAGYAKPIICRAGCTARDGFREALSPSYETASLKIQ